MARIPEAVTKHIIPEDHRKVNLGDSTHEFNAIRAASVTADTFTGNVTGNLTGNVTGNVNNPKRYSSVQLAKASGALTTADCGTLIVAVVDGAYTLPSAATAGAGAIISVMTGVASAGTGVVITRAGSDTINAKTTSAGSTAITGATSVTNSGATDVVWDYMELVSDGVDKWYSVGQTGTWA